MVCMVVMLVWCVYGSDVSMVCMVVMLVWCVW